MHTFILRAIRFFFFLLSLFLSLSMLLYGNNSIECNAANNIHNQILTCHRYIAIIYHHSHHSHHHEYEPSTSSLCYTITYPFKCILSWSSNMIFANNDFQPATFVIVRLSALRWPLYIYHFWLHVKLTDKNLCPFHANYIPMMHRMSWRIRLTTVRRMGYCCVFVHCQFNSIHQSCNPFRMYRSLSYGRVTVSLAKTTPSKW